MQSKSSFSYPVAEADVSACLGIEEIRAKTKKVISFKWLNTIARAENTQANYKL